MASGKEITIYDLAQHLSLSTTTVSRALNQHPAVNKKTSGKVNELARQLGYQKNSFASNLRHKSSYTIGVIIPKLDSHFITSVLVGVEEMIAESEYNIIIINSDEKSGRETSGGVLLFFSWDCHRYDYK